MSGQDAADRVIVVVDAEIADLIPQFLDNRRADVPRLREALEQGDFETLRVVGHSMKGSGGGYGFDAVTDLGAAIERAAKAADPQEAARRIDELETYLARGEVLIE